LNLWAHLTQNSHSPS